MKYLDAVLMKRGFMPSVSTLFSILFLVIGLTGCGKQPQVEEVRQFLTLQLPKDAPYSIGAVQIETSKIEGDKQLVKFKAEIRLEKPLFRQVDTEEQLRKSGWDNSQFTKAVSELQSLPTDTARKLIETHSLATDLPTIVEQVVRASEMRNWYGSVEANYVVDKWSFSNLTTQERGEFKGDPRDKFGTKSYLLGAADTTEAIEAAKKARTAFAETVATNIQLAAERKSREQAEQRVEELSLVQAQAARAAEVTKRMLPIQLNWRSASFEPGRKVLIIKNALATPLSIDMLVSDGQLQKRLHFDLPVGRPVEVGWLQGWSFKTGDSVLIQNLSYDPVRVRIP